MHIDNNNKAADSVEVYNSKSYVYNMIVILSISLLFLMMRFGAIIPDLEKLEIKGLRVLDLSKFIAALYLIWIYLYLIFYQKYWQIIRKDIIRLKQSIFEANFASQILRETHERNNHDCDWFNIYSLSYSPIMNFWISYSPVSFSEHGEEEHGKRHWVIDLKRKKKRRYIVPYIIDVYFKSPLITLYYVPILFPILAGVLCLSGKWPGSFSEIVNRW